MGFLLVSPSPLRFFIDQQLILSDLQRSNYCYRYNYFYFRTKRYYLLRYSLYFTWYLRYRIRRLISGVFVSQQRVGLFSGLFQRHQNTTLLSSMEQGSFLGRSSLISFTRQNQLALLKGGCKAHNSQIRQPNAHTSVCLLHMPVSICSGERQQVLGRRVEEKSSSKSSLLERLKPPSLRFFLWGYKKQTLEGLMFLWMMESEWMYQMAWTSWYKILHISSYEIFFPSALLLAISSWRLPPSQYSMTISTVTSFLLI